MKKAISYWLLAIEKELGGTGMLIDSNKHKKFVIPFV